jgi:DNA-binding MarR family transcriptional regulator
MNVPESQVGEFLSSEIGKCLPPKHIVLLFLYSKDVSAHYSQHEIKTHTGISLSSVSVARRSLEDLGYIKAKAILDHGYKTYLYSLTLQGRTYCQDEILKPMRSLCESVPQERG